MLERVFEDEARHPDVIVNDEPRQIKQDSHTRFWLQYCQAVADGIDMNVKQTPLEVQPIMVRCQLAAVDRDKKMNAIVRTIQAYLHSVILFDDLSDNSTRCIVTGNEELTVFNFPICKLVATAIESTYMPAIEKELLEKEGVVVVRFDSNAAVPLYGSSDERFIIAYDHADTDQENDLDLAEISYTEYSKVENGVMNLEDLPEDKSVDYWLPIILSLDYWRELSKTPSQVPSTRAKMFSSFKFTYDVPRLVSNMQVEDTHFDLDMHYLFISMWKRSRVIDPAYWKVIGQAFYTLENGDRRGLTGWIDILKSAYESSPKPNYFTGKNIRDTCSNIYSTFLDGEVDVRSLAEYAREDNPQKYNEWHSRWVHEAHTASLSGTEAPIGRLLYRLYWLEYVAHVTETRSTFYKFANHRLTRDQAGISLRIIMSSGLVSLYTAMKANIEYQKQQLLVNAATCDLAIKMVDEIINKLGKQRFKRDLLGDLAERFRCANIMTYMDASKEFTLVKNGVLCVSGHNIIFRSGKLQDYLVKSFGASYMQDYNWSHPRVQEAIEWARITFVDEDTMAFHWKFLASLLRGGNTEKKLVFWSGPTGNNMKTTWQLAVQKVCGAKCMNMPINYFTMGKGGANSATPSEIRREGSRLMLSEEPENRTPFLASIVKSVCGNCTESGRNLFEESRDFETQDRVVVVCNFPPPVAREGATDDRIEILEFGSQVRYDASLDRDEQFKQRVFPRDPLFDRKLPAMLDGILWIMVKTYPAYSREGISQPQSVIKATEAYWESIDRYNIFIKDCMEKEEGSNVEPFVLYNEFCRWWRQRYRREEEPDSDTAIRGFSRYIGVPTADGWTGYGLRRKPGAGDRANGNSEPKHD
ncbi:D5 DNA Primase [uncultured virus]|nr:D5 DNA Primase [uncultured virus]